MIHAEQPLDSFTAILAHNTKREFPYTFSVSDPQYNRLEFLLYNETVPSSDVKGHERINMSYRDLHLWITVRIPH
jgi:hypothetical protein